MRLEFQEEDINWNTQGKAKRNEITIWTLLIQDTWEEFETFSIYDLKLVPE